VKLDFTETSFSPSRSIWSYAKVQAIVSSAIRNRVLLANPFPREGFFVDIGPGANLSRDFYNIDWAWRPGVDRCIDITKGIGFPSGRVMGVFTEHCLEHITLDACRRVLREVRDALVEGGRLRVVVPDLELYARRYVESLDTGRNVMPYGEICVSGIRTAAMPFNGVMREHGHCFIYDFDTLRRLLEEAGFRDIAKWGYRQGDDPRLLRDSEYRRLESLYVEAQK
jgi:predicted SAM-dependent methyltransferase